MDLEGEILDHAKSHHGASRVPPARPATLRAAITNSRILDQVLGVRDPAPTATTLTAPAHGAAPTDEQPGAQGGERERGAIQTSRPGRETTREEGGHGHDAGAPALLPPGVGVDDKADEAPDLDRGAGVTHPGGARGPRDPASTPRQDLDPN